MPVDGRRAISFLLQIPSIVAETGFDSHPRLHHKDTEPWGLVAELARETERLPSEETSERMI